jgi:hypothetical protein
VWLFWYVCSTGFTMRHLLRPKIIAQGCRGQGGHSGRIWLPPFLSRRDMSRASCRLRSIAGSEHHLHIVIWLQRLVASPTEINTQIMEASLKISISDTLCISLSSSTLRQPSEEKLDKLLINIYPVSYPTCRHVALAQTRAVSSRPHRSRRKKKSLVRVPWTRDQARTGTDRHGQRTSTRQFLPNGPPKSTDFLARDGTSLCISMEIQTLPISSRRPDGIWAPLSTRTDP